MRSALYQASPRLDIRPTAYCRHCGSRLEVGYHFACHLCGAEYCFIHMSKHDTAHPRIKQGASYG